MFLGNYLKSATSSKNSTVIMQKGKTQYGGNKTARQIFLKANVYFVSGGKKCSFFGKFGELCFLVTFLVSFTLLPYYREFVS